MPGMHVKGGKLSVAQKVKFNQMIVTAEGLLGRHGTSYEIIELLRNRFKESERTCRACLAKARKRLVAKADIDVKHARGNSIAFWTSIIRDKTSDLRDKMFAQQRLDSIYAVDAPKKIDLEVGINQETSHAIRQRAIADAESRALMAMLSEKMHGVTFNFGEPVDLDTAEPKVIAGETVTQKENGETTNGATHNGTNGVH